MESFLAQSQNIMYLSLALGALLIAGSMTWLTILMIRIVRDIQQVIHKAKETLAVAHEVTTLAKGKLKDITTQFGLVSKGVAAILQWVEQKKETKTSKDDVAE